MNMRQALLVLGAGAFVAIVVLWPRPNTSGLKLPPPHSATTAESAETVPMPTPVSPAVPGRRGAQDSDRPVEPQLPIEPAAPVLSKPERLSELRDTFRALAAGDPTAALRAAHQLTNEVERETALLTLVTEWKHGELSSPRQRAWAIASQGLEAGLSTELAGNPELAQLWAAEFTNSQSRAVAPERLAAVMADADPSAALAYADQLPPDARRRFLASAFTTWAQTDTAAALQQAQQLADPAEQDAAMKAIRSVAPVGIGAELSMQQGYPVIGRLFPGAPAELSGQLHPGDRIVGVAQGNNAFMDTRTMPLSDVVQAIRGAPGTLLQLQVLPADAPPNSQPTTIPIVRDQIKYKR
jgi:PDZ domain